MPFVFFRYWAYVLLLSWLIFFTSSQHTTAFGPLTRYPHPRPHAKSPHTAVAMPPLSLFRLGLCLFRKSNACFTLNHSTKKLARAYFDFFCLRIITMAPRSMSAILIVFSYHLKTNTVMFQKIIFTNNENHSSGMFYFINSLFSASKVVPSNQALCTCIHGNTYRNQNTRLHIFSKTPTFDSMKVMRITMSAGFVSSYTCQSWMHGMPDLYSRIRMMQEIMCHFTVYILNKKNSSPCLVNPTGGLSDTMVWHYFFS
jgi:hypothetical protein